MHSIILLQQKTAQLTDDIKDILHASSINFQALSVSIQQKPTLLKQFYYLNNMLNQLKQQIDSRQHLHMSYLITKQIEEQQKRVRRERISQYQQKIYDQRRIIADKQAFYQSLLRPKKKKLPSQTVEQFQEIRAKEKDAEQKNKVKELIKQYMCRQMLKKHLDDNQKNNYQKYKVYVSQRVKLQSLSNVNSTAQGEFATENVIGLEEKCLSNGVTLVRCNSLQSHIRQPLQILSKQQSSQQLPTPQSLIQKHLQTLYTAKTQNNQLHNLYDQQLSLFKFKKQKYLKNKQTCKTITQNINNNKIMYDKMKKDEEWRYRVVNQPVKVQKRCNSGEKMRKKNK